MAQYSKKRSSLFITVYQPPFDHSYRMLDRCNQETTQAKSVSEKIRGRLLRVVTWNFLLVLVERLDKLSLASVGRVVPA